MKFNLSDSFKGLKNGVNNHSSQILIGFGIIGIFTTAVLAGKATLKASELVDDKERELNERLDKKEIVKTCWKCYIPTAASGVFSAACIVGAHSVDAKRNAALASAYKLTEAAFAEYRGKVVETIGEKKEKAVEDKIIKDKVEKAKADKTNEELLLNNDGKILYLDYWTGKLFRSTEADIKEAVNAVNYDLNEEGYAAMDMYYDRLNIDSGEMGRMLGWNRDKGLLKVYIRTAADDEPVKVVCFDGRNNPDYDYDKMCF